MQAHTSALICCELLNLPDLGFTGGGPLQLSVSLGVQLVCLAGLRQDCSVQSCSWQRLRECLTWGFIARWTNLL